MVKKSVRTCVCVALMCFVGAAFGADDGYLSPVALVADADGSALYVAEATAKQVAVFDVAAGKVAKTIPLLDSATGLALSPDGARLYIACAACVHVVDVAKAAVCGTLPSGHTPAALAVSPDGKTLYVCNRFGNDVSVVDIAAGTEAARIPVVREPVAAAVSPDGTTLLVANHLPAGPADGDYAAAVISIIDTASNKVAADLQLPNGCTGLRGVCVSPDGAYAYATHLLGRYQLPTTQLERGWMNTNALTVIDVAGKALVNTVLLDDVDLGAANPWGVACTADGKYLCVTHAGTHELSVIDRAGMHEKIAKVAAGEKVSEVSLSSGDVPNDLSFLVGLRRRIKLAGNGPRGLAVIASNAYAAEYFTDSIGVVDINPDVRPKAQSIALGPEMPLTVVRKGEIFFNDATLCFQHWQCCASCHPDVRTDGFNWDLLNDGMGNPKNTKSLLLSHRTPPAMVTGVRDTAEMGVRAGIKHIQFAVRPEEDAVAIDEYLKSLKPLPSPLLIDGKLSEAAVRGRAVYEQARCDACHSGELYTDLQMYNIGTGKHREVDTAFDTPTLVEVWRTAPYLHDGRATTMAELLTAHNAGDKHGVTSDLTEEQIGDLAEYVLSL